MTLSNVIEDNGRFDYRTGQAKGAPACVNLKTYPVRIANGKVVIDIGV